MILVFFRATPKLIIRKLSHPEAEVRVGTDRIHPICVGDEASNAPIFSAVIPKKWETRARKYPGFLGKGLLEVKQKNPTDYEKIAHKRVKTVDAEGNEIVTLKPMSEPIATGETVIETDVAPHTFAGFDPYTGEYTGTAEITKPKTIGGTRTII